VHVQPDSTVRGNESLFLVAISFSCQPCHVIVTSTRHNGISQTDLAHLQKAWPSPGFFIAATCFSRNAHKMERRLEAQKDLTPNRRPAIARAFCCLLRACDEAISILRKVKLANRSKNDSEPG
jgi:hypothetical protein